ncbi:hypothetical protein LTR36_010062 [Oleoguttula mirabilis]|uniref:Uncharacterized protein n=1 Tax=Oleoguttula mirabilis TaxID=1507867 RepID=A0AAV9JRF2_9PEZI|nr:hypothetical protein LTR36_010062 [Oleoguttula mirabilis]
MIHPDGIEVYLKPAGEDNEGRKYAEFPVSLDGSLNATDSDRVQRSTILASDEDIAVVVRCDSKFEMYTASALLVQIQDDCATPAGLDFHRRRVVQRSRVYEQRTFDTEHAYTMPYGKGACEAFPLHMGRHSAAANGGFDDEVYGPIMHKTVRPGSIIVAVCRGKARWNDKEANGTNASTSPYGSGNPALRRELKYGTTKPISSKNGQWYHFEFRYRSEACVRKAASMLVGAEKASIEIKDLAFVDDAKYARSKESDNKEREKLTAAWLKKQAAVAEVSISPYNSCRGQAAHGDAIIQPTLAASGQKRLPRKRQPPTFCDCPVRHRNQARRPVAPRAPKVSDTTPGAPRPPNSRLLSVASDGDESANADALELAGKPLAITPGLSPPKVCLTCKGTKIARNKRPAYLRQWYDTGDIPAKLAGDEDDDEPAVEAKMRAAAGNAAETETAANDIPAPSFQQVVCVEGAADHAAATGNAGTNAPTPSSQPVMPIEAAADHAVQAEKVSTNAPPPPPPVTPPEVAPQIVLTPRGDRDHAVAATTADATLTAGVGDMVELATAAHAEQASCRKGATSAELGSAKTSQPRIDIDLTTDDDDVVVMKMEQVSSTSALLGSRVDVGDDEDDLRDQLREVRLHKRKLELEEKEMKIEVKLRVFQRKKAASLPVKPEEAIKIED